MRQTRSIKMSTYCSTTRCLRIALPDNIIITRFIMIDDCYTVDVVEYLKIACVRYTERRLVFDNYW